MFSPSVFTLAHHFGRSKWRTLAYGCQAAGSALGGIVFPVSLRYLFPTVGFAWGVRTSERIVEGCFGLTVTVAFIVMLLATCSFFCLSTTHPPRKKLAILSPTVCEYVQGSSEGTWVTSPSPQHCVHCLRRRDQLWLACHVSGGNLLSAEYLDTYPSRLVSHTRPPTASIADSLSTRERNSACSGH